MFVVDLRTLQFTQRHDNHSMYSMWQEEKREPQNC